VKTVRITVIEKSINQKLIANHLPEERAAAFRACGHEVGETFEVRQPVMCPEGLCPWAWHDIESFVRIAAFEGTIEGQIPENSWVRCCTDAFRPVTFLIEPIEASPSKGAPA